MYLKKLLSAIFAVVLLLSLLVLPASADEAHVIDQVGMFTDEQIVELNAAIAEAEEASGVMFFVVTNQSKYNSKSAVLSVCGVSNSDDVCILVIKDDPADTVRYYDFYTNGMPSRRISDDEVDYILDDKAVYNNLKFNDPAVGVLRFLEITPSTMDIPYATIITVAIIIALIVAAITVGVVASKYKMKLRPTNYPLDQFAKLKLTHQEDHFIGKHVSVVVTSSGSSGGRSGGGGGRSGGGGARGSR